LIDLTRALEDRPEAAAAGALCRTGGLCASARKHFGDGPSGSGGDCGGVACLARGASRGQGRGDGLRAGKRIRPRGIDELHRQTVNLMSFLPIPKAIFDEQLVFNLLARFGDEAKQSLAALEERVESHLGDAGGFEPWLTLAFAAFAAGVSNAWLLGFALVEFCRGKRYGGD